MVPFVSMLKLTKSLERKLGNNINNFADKGSLAVNPSYITSWLDLMLTTPRVAPFLSKDGAFTMASKKELLDHVLNQRYYISGWSQFDMAFRLFFVGRMVWSNFLRVYGHV